MALVFVPLSKALEDAFLEDSLEEYLDIVVALGPLCGQHFDFLEGASCLRNSQSVSLYQNEDGELLWGERGVSAWL